MPPVALDVEVEDELPLSFTDPPAPPVAVATLVFTAVLLFVFELVFELLFVTVEPLTVEPPELLLVGGSHFIGWSCEGPQPGSGPV